MTKQGELFWSAIIALGLFALLLIKSCDPAYADELIQGRVQDRTGRTVLTVKPSGYPGTQRVVRDRTGRTQYIIKPSGYPGGKDAVQSRSGDKIDSWLWDEGDEG